jgi:predicted nucleic acid-binding protein
VTHLLVDTSVLIKWFHADGEGELLHARAIRAAHVSGDVKAHMLDLALYEVGNVLIRALGWPSTDAADQLDDLHTILGPPLVMSTAGARRAAGLAEAHRLSYYDASWASTALELGIPLVSADRLLLSAGLAQPPSEVAEQLQLPLG